MTQECSAASKRRRFVTIVAIGKRYASRCASVSDPAITNPSSSVRSGQLDLRELGAKRLPSIKCPPRRHPKLGLALLFTAPLAPHKPLAKPTAWTWLRKAERRAGLPKLAGGAYHPYRRLWASERDGLPDAAVAEAGGWKNEKVMKARYQRADAASVLAAVESRNA